jgi:hypothetical protein
MGVTNANRLIQHLALRTILCIRACRWNIRQSDADNGYMGYTEPF